MWTQTERDDNGQKLRGLLQRSVKADAGWKGYMDSVRAAWRQAKENIPEDEIDAYFDEWVKPTLDKALEEGKSDRTIRLIKQELFDPAAVRAVKDRKNARARWQRAAKPQRADPPEENPSETKKATGRPPKEGVEREPNGKPSRRKPKPIRPSLLALLKSLTDEQQRRVEEFATTIRGEMNV